MGSVQMCSHGLRNDRETGQSRNSFVTAPIFLNVVLLANKLKPVFFHANANHDSLLKKHQLTSRSTVIRVKINITSFNKHAKRDATCRGFCQAKVMTDGYSVSACIK